MSIKCDFPGCPASVENGDTIYRTSPKGERFIGRCSRHIGDSVDPEVREITEIIEQDNRRA